jgi:hypothetical protein
MNQITKEIKRKLNNYKIAGESVRKKPRKCKWKEEINASGKKKLMQEERRN